MKIYGVTIVSSDGDIYRENMNGKKGCFESVTRLFTSREDAINYAVNEVPHWFNIDEQFEDRVNKDKDGGIYDENDTTLDEFKQDLANGIDIFIQYHDFHVQFEYFVEEMNIKLTEVML